MLDIGYKNYIEPKQIKQIISPNSSKAKWLKKEAIEGRTLIDCTQGRKTNCMIILKTNHLVLSSLRYNSLIRRIKAISNNNEINQKDVSITEELLKAIEK